MIIRVSSSNPFLISAQAGQPPVSDEQALIEARAMAHVLIANLSARNARLLTDELNILYNEVKRGIYKGPKDQQCQIAAKECEIR